MNWDNMIVYKKKIIASIYCIFIPLLASCQTTMFQDHEKKIVIKPEVMNDFLRDKPKETHRFYRNVMEHGERNVVLNHMRSGLAALELGALKAAEQSFELSVNKIEAIYADNKKAEAARSIFTKENIKDFKGEAYERAMAFYYRGLIYLMRGDYGNAQASFGAGLLQDSFAESEKYQQDFAALAFLRGWAYRCQGSAAASVAQFSEAMALHNKQLKHLNRPQKLSFSRLTAPAEGDNVLLIGESGFAPRKMAAGASNERLVYRRGARDPVALVGFKNGKKVYTAYPFEDVFWQASTRGGRPVDFIMAGKASFKQGAQAVGNAAFVGAAAAGAYAMQTNNRDAAIATGVLLLGGLIAQGIANAAQPDADLRQWDNLPEHIYLGTARIEPGVERLGVFFVDARIKPVPADYKVVKIIRRGACGVAWVRRISALRVPNEPPKANSPDYLVNKEKSPH